MKNEMKYFLSRHKAGAHFYILTKLKIIGIKRHENIGCVCVCMCVFEGGGRASRAKGLLFSHILEGQPSKVACKAHAGRQYLSQSQEKKL